MKTSQQILKQQSRQKRKQFNIEFSHVNSRTQATNVLVKHELIKQFVSSLYKQEIEDIYFAKQKGKTSKIRMVVERKTRRRGLYFGF